MVAKLNKAEKAGGRETTYLSDAAPSSEHSRRSRSLAKPSWLLCAIADLDERMKKLAQKIPRENNGDTFAARANYYYHERPRFLELLQDMYNSYLALADRYCQALAKNHHLLHRDLRSSPIPPLKFDHDSQFDEDSIDSDAESSLSFQPPYPSQTETEEVDPDLIVADLVMKNVKYEIMVNELSIVDMSWRESSRKIEIQKSLLDVLESERSILLNDNATLGYRVEALVEENKGLASESLFLKRKAAELARCLLKTREDHRVCMLSRKIEDLQGQIYGLEKRNKEYYEQLVKQEEEKSMGKNGNGKGKNGGVQVALEDCFQMPGGGGGTAASLSKCFGVYVEKQGKQKVNGFCLNGGKKRVSVMWGKVKKFDLFPCGPHFNSPYC